MKQIKNNIQNIVSSTYPLLIEKCDNLYFDIYQSALELYGLPNDNNDYYKNTDFRLAALTRLLSVVINTKTNLYIFNEFVKKKNWSEEYSSKILILNNEPYFGYIKDLDTDYRFLFYTQFFSQIESFAESLKRFKIISGKDSLLSFLKLSESYEERFVYFIKAIRNSIHNNGYYFPDYDKYHVEYGKIELHAGQQMDFFDWKIGFELCHKLFKQFILSLKSEQLSKIAIISDSQFIQFNEEPVRAE